MDPNGECGSLVTTSCGATFPYDAASYREDLNVRARILSLVALLLSATSGMPAAAAQTPTKTPLTVEWIFDDEGRQVASLPSHAWLMDGSLLLYDGRQPQSKRVFELLDPSTGVRRAAFDMAAAVASLNALMPNSEAMQTLENTIVGKVGDPETSDLLDATR